jgi:hypothetical protein
MNSERIWLMIAPLFSGFQAIFTDPRQSWRVLPPKHGSLDFYKESLAPEKFL